MDVEEKIGNLLRDEEYREELAKAAYYRERTEDAAVDREQSEDSDDFVYYVMAWEDISDHAKRPYRTAVMQALDEVADVLAAV